MDKVANVSARHLVVFLSAALGFLMQLTTARLLLPETGGIPIVWVIVSVCFQACLLIGYIYARILGSAPPVFGRLGHICILAVIGLAFVPPRPEIGAAADLGLGILAALITSAAGPASILASHLVIMGNVSRKYDFSLFRSANGGTLALLAIYPFLDSFVGLTSQLQIIQWGYWAVVLACIVGLVGGIRVVREDGKKSAGKATGAASKPSLSSWTGVFIPSALSVMICLTFTTHASTALVPTPVIWIIPFGLYLISWMVAFSQSDKASKAARHRVLLVMPFLLIHFVPAPHVVCMLVNSVVCYFMFLALHSIVFQHRSAFEGVSGLSTPSTYYMLMTAGGIIGSVATWLLSGLVPPVYSYPALVWLGLTTMPAGDLFQFSKKLDPRKWKTGVVAWYLMLLVAAVVATGNSGSVLWSRHGPFGTLTVAESMTGDGMLRRMSLNGVIQGEQLVQQVQDGSMKQASAPKRRLGYYGWIEGLRGKEFHGPVRWCLLGLGPGTLAALTEDGDSMDIMEINKDLVEATKRYFTYLDESPAKWQIIIGDGRKEMRKSTGVYDIIVADAYQGSSIPMHMFTKEFFKILQDHLTTNGIILLHISHGALDLEPSAGIIAESLDMQSHVVKARTESGLGSKWVVMSRKGRTFSEPMTASRASGSPWSDDLAPVWQALRWPWQVQL